MTPPAQQSRTPANSQDDFLSYLIWPSGGRKSCCRTPRQSDLTQSRGLLAFEVGPVIWLGSVFEERDDENRVKIEFNFCNVVKLK